jgi:hypothetical protein
MGSARLSKLGDCNLKEESYRPVAAWVRFPLAVLGGVWWRGMGDSVGTLNPTLIYCRIDIAIFKAISPEDYDGGKGSSVRPQLIRDYHEPANQASSG